jgi:hypothetical protein
MKRMGREEGKGWPKRKEQNVKEEKQVPHPDILPPSGAGNDGSKEVVHSYTKDTPGQIVKKIKTFKQYTK